MLAELETVIEVALLGAVLGVAVYNFTRFINDHVAENNVQIILSKSTENFEKYSTKSMEC